MQVCPAFKAGLLQAFKWLSAYPEAAFLVPAKGGPACGKQLQACFERGTRQACEHTQAGLVRTFGPAQGQHGF